jgi:hypothetical protein
MPTQSSTSEPGTYVFSPRELQRLAVYRAAVVAHFYTDQCDSIDPAEWARSYDTVIAASAEPDAN